MNKRQAKVPTTITKSYSPEDRINPPLTKPQVKARLDWLSEMIPLFGQGQNPTWFNWAVARVDELNQLLKRPATSGSYK